MVYRQSPFAVLLGYLPYRQNTTGPGCVVPHFLSFYQLLITFQLYNSKQQSPFPPSRNKTGDGFNITHYLPASARQLYTHVNYDYHFYFTIQASPLPALDTRIPSCAKRSATHFIPLPTAYIKSVVQFKP